MWGRAGRRGRGLAVYVAGEDALDQFFCRHPDEFLDRPVESAILDYENEGIHLSHLLCAAHEGPLAAEDAETLGPRWEAHAQALVASGDLVERRGVYLLRRPEDYPAARVSLRSASADSFAVIDVASGELLGDVEAARAFSTVHQGAVYLHLGRSYVVRELDLGGRRALVVPHDERWYTQPKTETLTWIEGELARRDVCGVPLSFGRVSVTETVIGYQRKSLPDHAVVDLVTLDLPETTFETQALWYVLDDEALADVSERDLLGALHAAEHSQIAVLPLIAMCDRWDIGGLSTNLHPQTGAPTIFIYDGHPGRRRDHSDWACEVRESGGRRAPPRERMPVRVGLPVVRAVAQVREPERAALQARLGGAHAPHAGLLTALLQPCSFGSANLCNLWGVQGLSRCLSTLWPWVVVRSPPSSCFASPPRLWRPRLRTPPALDPSRAA